MVVSQPAYRLIRPMHRYIPGTPPNLKRPPQGCRFAERCKYAQPSCKVNAMPMIDFEDNRSYRCGLSVEQLREVYKSED